MNRWFMISVVIWIEPNFLTQNPVGYGVDACSYRALTDNTMTEKFWQEVGLLLTMYATVEWCYNRFLEIRKLAIQTWLACIAKEDGKKQWAPTHQMCNATFTVDWLTDA